MERKQKTGGKPSKARREEQKAAEKLNKPRADPREVTIAPGKGPDVVVE